MPHQLVTLHAGLGTLLMVAAAACGLWGTLSFALRRGVDRRFRLGYLILTGVALLQVLLDLAFLIAGAGGRRPWAAPVSAVLSLLVLVVPYLLSSRWSREGEAAALCLACWVAAVAFGGGLVG